MFPRLHARFTLLGISILLLAFTSSCESRASRYKDDGGDAWGQDAQTIDAGDDTWGDDSQTADDVSDSGQEDACDGEDTQEGDDTQSNDDGPIDEWFGPEGGAVDLLHFAVIGDVRPPDLDEDNAYPDQTVQQIFTQIAARQAQVVLGTGDWMFATNESHARAQLASLLDAESPYDHTVIHALGNHECNGWTDSNCPNFNETGQVRAYMDMLLPFSDRAYFSFRVLTRFGDAKFVFAALNGWSANQNSWLNQKLDEQTDYTFVIAHEPPSDDRAPGVKPFQAILATHPGITLVTYGHEHEYRHISANQVISGNAGAPLTNGAYFGYLWVQQLEDGNIQVSEHHIDTDEEMDAFTLSPDGVLE